MLVILRVSSAIWCSLARLSCFLYSASKLAPRAPIPAASVGVAAPAKIEPSTIKINKIGAKTVATDRVACCSVVVACSVAPACSGFNQENSNT